MKKSNSEPEKLIKAITESLRKKDLDVTTLGDPMVGSLVRTRIPTSSRMLNSILGGGIPCGRITEIFGAESNGKSSLGADILGNVQKLGGLAVIIDSEGAFSPDRAIAMGVDPEEVIYSDAAVLEDVFSIMEYVLDSVEETDPPVVLLWDSVAAASSKRDLEGEIGDQQMAEAARILSRGCRRITGMMKSNIAVVFINQVRSRIGMHFGKDTESTGGKAIKFYASVRIELTGIGKVKVQDKPVGIKVKANTVKNKTGYPFKTAEYEMYFAGGIDDSSALLDLMVDSGDVKQAGSWYSIGDKKFMRKDFKKTIESLGKVGEELLTKALEIL